MPSTGSTVAGVILTENVLVAIPSHKAIYSQRATLYQPELFANSPHLASPLAGAFLTLLPSSFFRLLINVLCLPPSPPPAPWNDDVVPAVNFCSSFLFPPGPAPDSLPHRAAVSWCAKVVPPAHQQPQLRPQRLPPQLPLPTPLHSPYQR